LARWGGGRGEIAGRKERLRTKRNKREKEKPAKQTVWTEQKRLQKKKKDGKGGGHYIGVRGKT